jgi:hypothetical protein
MLSCKNAKILGEPGKGIHRLRLGGIALVDFILTFLVAVGLSYIPSSPPLTIWLIFLLILAMMLHSGFCTKTGVTVWLENNIWIFCGFLIISAIILIILNLPPPFAIL